MSFGRLMWWGCIALATLLLFSLAGCYGYKKYTQRDGIAHFSFEYSEDYKESYIDLLPAYTSVGYDRWQNDGWFDSGFRVGVYKSGWGDYQKASDLLDHDIQFGYDSKEDYQILERSPISIDSIKGELLISSYTPGESHESDLKEPTLLINRTVYFDYKGLIWEINMISIEKVAEADEPIWEHLIETFKILD
jgi:hypothetical protein